MLVLILSVSFYHFCVMLLVPLSYVMLCYGNYGFENTSIMTMGQILVVERNIYETTNILCVLIYIEVVLCGGDTREAVIRGGLVSHSYFFSLYLS